MIKSQYENTSGLSLLESGILLERELTNRVLIATVLALALKEQFTIKRTANDSTGAIDIELFRNGSFGDQSTLDSNEKLLLGIMFKNFRDDRIHFSDMMELTTHLPFDAQASIRDDIIHRLTQKGLFGRGGLHITALNIIFFCQSIYCQCICIICDLYSMVPVSAVERGAYDAFLSTFNIHCIIPHDCIYSGAGIHHISPYYKRGERGSKCTSWISGVPSCCGKGSH
jgi:hypothetical protein